MYHAIHTRRELDTGIENFEREVKAVYSSLVLPGWGKELHGFPQTLYGYMMGLFSRIDVLSAYWRGDEGSRGQTRRMIDFLDYYLSSNHEANHVAVKMWRHKLMHTSEPRNLYDTSTSKSYRWLLHWWEHLPVEQHYTILETADVKILNIGLIYLVEDVKRATEKYVTDLELSPSLQQNYDTVETAFASYKL